MPVKLIIFIFFIGIYVSTYAQVKRVNPPSVSKEFKYDSVVAYECKKNIKGWIVMNEKLYAKIINKEKKISQPLVDTLTNFLWLISKSEKKVTPECWNSHLGIVYYLAGKPIAHFNISKECSAFYLYFRPNINSEGWSITEFSFTELQRKKITWLCASLGFTYY